MEEGFGSVRNLYEKARKVDGDKTLDMTSVWTRAQPNHCANKKLQELQLLHSTVPEV